MNKIQSNKRNKRRRKRVDASGNVDNIEQVSAN